MAEAVTSLLQKALRLVQQRRPAAYDAMAQCLDGLSLSAAIEDVITLRSERGTIEEVHLARHADVRLRVDRSTLQALLAGRVTLSDALRAGALDLAGTTDALSRAMFALEYFVCALLVTDGAVDLRRELDRQS